MIREKIKNLIFFFLNVVSALVRPFISLPRVSILMYHSVADNRVLFTVFPKDFERQMEYLKKKKFKVISLKELVDKLEKAEKIADKTIILTFDDGFEDNFRNAWPTLKKYGFSATIFLPTNYIGKEINNSQNIPIKVLDERQIKEMSDSGLVDFGSHTHTHPRLENISEGEFFEELKKSKEIIEQITGKRCDLFGYPKGTYRDGFSEILKNSNFRAAATVEEGLIKNGDNRYSLKRNFVYSSGGFGQFRGKLNFSVAIFNKLKTIFK